MWILNFDFFKKFSKNKKINFEKILYLDGMVPSGRFWSIQIGFVHRHHNEPGVQLNCAEGRNIPQSKEIHWCNKVYLPWSGRLARKACWWLLECLLDQKLVRFVERFHEVPPQRYIHKDQDIHTHLSDYWTRFTKFTLLKEEHPKRRLTKIEATTKPDHVWPEVWTKLGNTAQNREKQEWAKEKTKLDNAQRLRWSYIIDPDDEECKERKKMMRKVEDPWLQPCRAEDNQASRKWLRSF